MNIRYVIWKVVCLPQQVCEDEIWINPWRYDDEIYAMLFEKCNFACFSSSCFYIIFSSVQACEDAIWWGSHHLFFLVMRHQSGQAHEDEIWHLKRVTFSILFAWGTLVSPSCFNQVCEEEIRNLKDTGCFFNWYPPKKLKYGKPRWGVSTLT